MEKFSKVMSFEMSDERMDMGRVTGYLTLKLNEAMDSVNPKR